MIQKIDTAKYNSNNCYKNTENKTALRKSSFQQVLEAVTLLELINSTARIYQLLLAGIVRMAFATNFYLNRVAVLGRATYKAGSASANDSNVMIIRLDILVHIITYLCKILYSMIIHTLFL